MATFTKRDLSRLGLLTFCTLGVYPLYWSVITRRELKKAGGDVPNAIWIFIPFADIYFWYYYAKAYTKVIQKSSKKDDILVNSNIAYLPQYVCYCVYTKGYSSSRVASMLIKNYSDTQYFYAVKFAAWYLNNLILLSFVLAILTLIRMYYFQNGFNNYQE